MTLPPIAERIQVLRQNIAAVAERCGRNPADIQCILVTKTVDELRILEAYQTGMRDFAENKVQEFLTKEPKLPSDIRWHFIGHLQTNKVKDILGKTALIHSLDRPELVERLALEAIKKEHFEIPCLIQINSSGETTKFGLSPSALESFVNGLKGIGEIQIKGLMTLGPLTDNHALIRRAFRLTRDLALGMKKKFPQFSWNTLSMGMSGDYEIAIEEGATMVRIGTAVFGERIEKQGNK